LSLRKLRTIVSTNYLEGQPPHTSAAVRDRLRSTCLATGAWPDQQLLAPISDEELTQLLSPQFPPEWQGYVCFAVMAPDERSLLLPETAPFRHTLRVRVLHHLLNASPAVLAGYLKQAKPYISTYPALLQSLLQPHSNSSAAFLDRLIDAGASIVEAGDWVKLLGELNVYNAPEWQGFLFQNDHLAKLLAGFRADPAGRPLWSSYLDLLSAELFNDDPWEKTLHDQLRKAQQSLGAAGVYLGTVLPPGGAAKLHAVEILSQVMANPASAAGFHQGELLQACQLFWPTNPLTGLQRIYLKCGFDKLDLSVNAQQLNPFIVSFLACYPISPGLYQSASVAVAKWLELSNSCPDLMRAAFQVYFVQLFVPPHFLLPILDEPRAFQPFLPGAYAQLRAPSGSPSPPSELFTPAGGTAESEEEDGYKSAATKRFSKTKGQERGTGRRQSAGGSAGPILAIVVVVLMLLGILIAVIINSGGKSTRPTEPETAPQPKVDHNKKDDHKKDDHKKQKATATSK
jgi:hypothetical protein